MHPPTSNGHDNNYFNVLPHCINTTTASYILDDRQCFPYLDAMDMEAWLWRQWFRPYVTTLEPFRYFVQTFALKYGVVSSKRSDIRADVIALHCGSFEQSESLIEATFTSKSVDSPPSISGPLRVFSGVVPQELSGMAYMAASALSLYSELSLWHLRTTKNRCLDLKTLDGSRWRRFNLFQQTSQMG